MGITAVIGVGLLGAGLSAASNAGAFGKPGGSLAPPQPPPSMPIAANADAEPEARKAAEKRRRSYANLGRSGTILTGPTGLDFEDAAEHLYSKTQGKQLLGL